MKIYRVHIPALIIELMAICSGFFQVLCMSFLLDPGLLVLAGIIIVPLSHLCGFLKKPTLILSIATITLF